MKISEYRLLEEAFNNSWGFMMNRITDIYDRLDLEDVKTDETVKDRAFSEFIIALEEMGVELGETLVETK